MKSLIVPVCGKSTRFQGLRPKPLLTAPSGNSMLAESIKGLPSRKNIDIYVVALAQHESEYGFKNGIQRQIAVYFPNNVIQWIFLEEQTNNQVETVYKGIKQANIEGQILIKDCDNYFEIDDFPEENFVAVDNLHNHTSINAANKSYVQLNDSGLIQNIVEKRIVSEWFCTGLYSFVTAASFCAYYETINDYPQKLNSRQEDDKVIVEPAPLYISDIIYKMLLDNIEFSTVLVKYFEDWGTLQEWEKYCNSFENIDIDLDGCLVGASCPYMKPLIGETSSLPNNINFINKKYDSGRAHITVKTARPKYYRDITEKQLRDIGLKYHELIMGVFHARRTIINDYASTLKYPGCRAINLPRNADNLEDYFN